MKIEKVIQSVSGGGKTEEIIHASDSKSLIVTKTMILSEDIKRRAFSSASNIQSIHYHQLIWDTAINIGMPLSLDNWNKYEDTYLFESKKDLIRKYSKIFIDIESNDCSPNWVSILKRYFLEDDGEIFRVSSLIKGKSFRLNSSITTLTNNVFNFNIQASNQSEETNKSFYIPSNKTTIINDIEKILKHNKDVTILASEVNDIKDIEEQLDYQKHLSFITRKEENEFRGSSLDFHWFKKNRTLAFNPNHPNLKMATIEAFKGLEHKTIIFIFTPNTSKEAFYIAMTRSKNSFYILNMNSQYSDTLRLNVDKIIPIDKVINEDNIYLGLLPQLKEKILRDFFKEEYQKYRDITLNLDIQILNRFSESYEAFFTKIFPSNQPLNIYNFTMHKKKQQLALTHDDTNILLIVEQSINKEHNTNDNYLLCVRIENKDKYIFNEKLEVSAKLIVPKQIYRNEHHSDVDISVLVQTIKENYASIIPIEETLEYKKWLVYLELLENKLKKKSEAFKVNIEYLEDNFISFIKPKNKNLKFTKDTEILINDETNTKFAKIVHLKNNRIILELAKNIKYKKQKKFELVINNIGEEVQLNILKRGLKDIKYHDFRFYIFGNKRLASLDNWENLEIKYRESPLGKELNYKQKEAVNKALISENMFMIQGPPGTGKTSVISEIAYQETIRGKKVLISSESNDAIENALERLNEDIFYPILYQSMSRQEKNTSTDLPIEKDIGNFYKQRILRELKEEIHRLENMDIHLISVQKKIREDGLEIENNLKKFQEFEKNQKRIENYARELREELSILQSKYQEEKSKSKNQKRFLDIQENFLKELQENTKCEEELKNTYLKKVNISGATLNQINKVAKKINNDEPFDVVIIDEVSKATPIELNLAILKAKKIILVGDQKQLPPMLNRDVTLEEFAENLFTNTEHYETKAEVKKELHEHKTIFEKLIENNPDAYTQLTIQYRMHEDIQRAINQFYDEELECGIENHKLKNKHRLFDSEHLVWVDTSSFQENRIGTSFENMGEVRQTEKILEKLNSEYKNIDFKPSVGVISFYGKQVNKLANIQNDFKNIKVDFGTVDTFQGQERDFIIVSMVRSNKNANIGFARSLNRINVAFSRAKQLLVILGSKETFTNIKVSDDKDIKKAKKIYGNILNVSSLEGTLK
jgi:hypothetical protein